MIDNIEIGDDILIELIENSLKGYKEMNTDGCHNDIIRSIQNILNEKKSVIRKKKLRRILK